MGPLPLSRHSLLVLKNHETVQCLIEWMDTCHRAPKRYVFIWFSNQLSCNILTRFDIKLVSTGPYTPWPNRAEAAVRVFEAIFSDLCAQLGFSPELKHVTVRILLRKEL